MNMMRFNEGGVTSDMLQQAMEAQAANMGQDITGDSFILTGQYSSPVQQEEDGREYVEYQHPDMQEPVKVYGNWNEYAVSQDENGMMLIGDEDYPIMQDEEGNYMLNEQKFDDQMTAMTERQGAEAMAREAAQGSTQGASKMENLMEMLQDAQGPQGQGGQYEEGGEIPEYFLGGLMGKSNKMIGNMRDKVRGAGRGLAGASGLGMMKQLMGRMRARRGGGSQEAQASQVSSGAMDRTFEPKPVKEFFAGGILSNPVFDRMNQMREQAGSRAQMRRDYRQQQQEAQFQQQLEQQYGPIPGAAPAQPMQQPMQQVQQPMQQAAPQPQIGTLPNGDPAMVLNQQPPTGQVPVQDPNAAVANQAAAMAQPQAGVATIGGGRGVMQDGGKVIKAYEDGGKNGPDSGLGEGPFSQSIRLLDEKAQGAMGPFGKKFSAALSDGKSWAKEMKDALTSRGYTIEDVKDGNVPAHVLAANLTDGSAGKAFRDSLKDHSGIRSFQDVTELNTALRTYGSQILDGRIDVASVDSSMSSLGYEDKDAKFMSGAMAAGSLVPSRFIKEEFESGEGQSSDKHGDTLGIPTANEFRERFKGSMNRQGEYKGDKQVLFRSDFYEDTGSEEMPIEKPRPEAVDPLATLDPSKVPSVRVVKDIKGQIVPIEQVVITEEEEEEEVGGGGGGLPRMDLSFDTFNPSDYTGGEAQRATGPFADQTEMDRRMSGFEAGGRVVKYSKGGSFPDLNKDGKITMADILKGRGVKGEYAYGGKMRSYEDGGKDPNEMVSYKGKMMKRSQMEAMWAQEDAEPQRISGEDLYKKYLKSRDKGSYMRQEGVSDIIKEQERLFEQRGNKFADGTGYRDLFEYGGRVKSYASGGKVLRYR